MTGLDVKRNAVMIDVACNDPDNGIFAHRAEMISIGYEFLELECFSRGPRFHELPGAIKLSRRKWKIVGAKEWVGNWCWNGYWMEIPEAVRFLAWLQSTRLYHCTCGEMRIYNIWNSEKPLDKGDLEFFDRMLGKPSTYTAAA